MPCEIGSVTEKHTEGIQTHKTEYITVCKEAGSHLLLTRIIFQRGIKIWHENSNPDNQNRDFCGKRNGKKQT